MAIVIEPDLTIFARGNASRADDGIGPLIAERIRMLGNPCLEIIEDMQLSIEHATDIRPGVPALFIDASVAIDRGFTLERLRPLPDPSVSTHSLSPAALLHLYESTINKPAPNAYQLHVAGVSFELGGALSDEGRRAVDVAWRFLRRLLAEPCDRWGEALELACVETLPNKA